MVASSTGRKPANDLGSGDDRLDHGDDLDPGGEQQLRLSGRLVGHCGHQAPDHGHTGERNHDVRQSVDHRDARWVRTPPNATGAREWTCQTWSPRRCCPKACVEEEQWPPSESPRLAGARATRTPAGRSSRLLDTRSPPRVSPVHRCAPSRPKPAWMRRLIHHYFDSKQQLFLATVALPLELPGIVEQVAAGDRGDLGERLVRTVLGVWDSELQPSLVAAIRTTLTDPALDSLGR